MAKRHRQPSRAELLARIAWAEESKKTVVGFNIAVMADILIFHDSYGWTEEEISNHIDLMKAFYDSVLAGNEDLEGIINNIRDELGINVLSSSLEEFGSGNGSAQ